MSLQDAFSPDQTDLPTYSWTHLIGRPSARKALVKTLAERIVASRCPPHYLEAWIEARDHGSNLFGTIRRGFSAAIAEVLGLPGRDFPDDHLEGFIAEALWRSLSQDHTHRLPLEWIASGWNPTDPGGDGLIVHKEEDGSFSFRLWEVKKTIPSGDVSPTIRRAARQLRERAPHYLARYMKVGEAQTSGAVRELFGYLLDRWLDEDRAAAAGVAVVAEDGPAPSPCFQQLPDEFPGLCTPSRLRGLLGSIPNFRDFCKAVQAEVWTAL